MQTAARSRRPARPGTIGSVGDEAGAAVSAGGPVDLLTEADDAYGPAKYVFVTGGVVSSLGKGITAASLGRLLKARGLKVQVQKFDPYINVDPGTMSPFQHGEVFVTEDGAETDLDIGHYERFIDENLSRAANHTAGARLGPRAAQGAQGRVPRLDRAGDPAHHERDQGAHPLASPRRPTPTS